MVRRDPSRAGLAGRDAAAVLGVLLVVGVVCGVVWSQVVTPAQFTKLAQGGSMGEDELSKRFAADGWYVVIALVAGVLSGLGLAAWRRRDPLLTSVLLVLGSALAAVAMLVVGHLLGPGDPKAALEAAKVGAQVPQSLDVDTFIVYLSWPAGVLFGALFVLLGRGREQVDAEPSEAAESADSMTPTSPAG